MYSSPWCGDCRLAKKFLNSRSLEYEHINIAKNPEAVALIIEKNNGKRKVPTFEVDGRWFAVSPFDPAHLEEQLSLASA
jgi:mycoredoxin